MDTVMTTAARLAPFTPAACKSYSGDGLDYSKYLMEPKLDGFRLQIIVDNGTVKCYTRSLRDVSGRLPHIESELAKWAGGTLVIDAEVIYVSGGGSVDFNYSASVMGSGAAVAVRKQELSRKWLTVSCFDVLFAGDDVRALTLEQRRAALEVVIDGLAIPYLVVTEQTEATPKQHAKFTKRYGEGSVMKRKGSTYPRGRTNAWIKWKADYDEDVVVMGAEPGKGKFDGMVGALVFGQYRDGVLVERGTCSGMTDVQRQAFTDDIPVGRVMVIKHNGVLALGGFRHPQFKGFREDKAAEQCDWSEALV